MCPVLLLLPLLKFTFLVVIRNTCPHNYIFNLINNQPIVHITLMFEIKDGFYLSANSFFAGKLM